MVCESTTFSPDGLPVDQGCILKILLALEVFLKSPMRSGWEVGRVAVWGSSFDRAALIYSRIDVQRAI